MENAWTKVRVAKKERVAQDIVSLELVSTEGCNLPNFSAGSHIDLELPRGLVRQYSLCNDMTEQHRYRIAVLLDPATRGGSKAVHEQLQQGDVIRVSAPRNHFALVPARHAVLMAGGIGVTPLLCMAQRLSATGIGFEMHYCTRSRDRTAFLEDIQQAAYAERVHFHFDDGDAEQKLDIDKVLGHFDDQTHLYVCGPKGYMDFVIASAKRLGWPDSQVHFEYFAGQTVDASTNAAFQVKVASTGEVIDVPADKSILTALTERGVSIPMSCEQGVCGTCVVRVLEGTPDHRDLYFTDEEKAKNDQFTPCCSRSKSALLVLDV